MYNQPPSTYAQPINLLGQPSLNTMPTGSVQGARPYSPSGRSMTAGTMPINQGSLPMNATGLKQSASGMLPGSGATFTTPQSNQAYPLTYMQNSPLNNLGYSYPQMFPSTGSGVPGGYGYAQGLGYGYQPGAYQFDPRTAGQFAGQTGIKSAT